VSPTLGRFDYSDDVAAAYDDTRAASASVLRPLRECLAGAPGRRLADVGGGTGNYAAALRDLDGFEPLVVDVSADMLERAVAKGLATKRGDARRLPLPDASFDAATMMAMLHHVPDWRVALAEARRILVPGGRLAIMGWAAEHAAVFWPLRYFPASIDWFMDTHPALDEALAELPGATVTPIVFDDLDDQSLAALSRSPADLVRAGRRRETGLFGRMIRDAPAELDAGLDRLERDLAAGARPHEAPEVMAARAERGDAAILCWTKPR